MNTCTICGGIKFHSWVVYHDHMKHMHSVHLTSELKPIKTTDRTKAEIVKDVEVRFSGQILTPYDVQLHEQYADCKVVAPVLLENSY